jgi:hypothetical protein
MDAKGVLTERVRQRPVNGPARDAMLVARDDVDLHGRVAEAGRLGRRRR